MVVLIVREYVKEEKKIMWLEVLDKGSNLRHFFVRLGGCVVNDPHGCFSFFNFIELSISPAGVPELGRLGQDRYNVTSAGDQFGLPACDVWCFWNRMLTDPYWAGDCCANSKSGYHPLKHQYRVGFDWGRDCSLEATIKTNSATQSSTVFVIFSLLLW